jgi:hypothetical protein
VRAAENADTHLVLGLRRSYPTYGQTKGLRHLQKYFLHALCLPLRNLAPRPNAAG